MGRRPDFMRKTMQAPRRGAQLGQCAEVGKVPRRGTSRESRNLGGDKRIILMNTDSFDGARIKGELASSPALRKF